MRQSLLAGVVLALALAACNKPAPQPATGPAAKAPATTAAKPEPQRKPGHRLSAEEIAQIEATGRTGLWSDVDAACEKGPRPRATLTWNVKASGATHVVLYLVDKTGKERHFGRGGPVGSRVTGPWLRPGSTFRIRDPKNGTELGSVVIGKKAC